MRNHSSTSKILFTFTLLVAAVLIGWRASRQTVHQAALAKDVIATQKPLHDSPPPAEREVVAPPAVSSSSPTTIQPAPAQPVKLTATPIAHEELDVFKPFVWPSGKPHYEGEPVTAYVRVGSSGEQSALTVSQGGEYPRVQIQPREKVQVRLKFGKLAPHTPVAFTAQDGGAFSDGKKGAMFLVDEMRELSFAFSASANEGTHRVTFATPQGETKVLDFWVGPFNETRKLTLR